MRVTDSEQFVQDGHPIEEMDVEGSRFDRISLKITDDSIIVRGRELGTDEVTEVSFDKIPDKVLNPVVPSDGRRRDIDDDIQDILQIIGYVAVDDNMMVDDNG